MRLSTFKEDIDHREIIMSKILIIEDDRDIADLISIHMNEPEFILTTWGVGYKFKDE